MLINNKSKQKQKEQEERFLSLINSNHDKLYKIAYSYVRNMEDALDIVQETVYKGYLSYHKVKQPEYEKTWLVKILINTAIDFAKKNEKIATLDKCYIENVTDSITSNIDEKLTVEHVLKNLTEKQRAVITLRYFEGMKIDEIAEIFDEPASTIKSILYRTLDRMKIDLMEVDIGGK